MSLGVLSRSHLAGDFNSFHTRALLGADSSPAGCCDETSVAEEAQPPQGPRYSLRARTCPWDQPNSSLLTREAVTAESGPWGEQAWLTVGVLGYLEVVWVQGYPKL